MEKERKTKLLGYIFPDEKARQFLCNDMFMELGEIIPQSLCISTKNTSPAVRKENLHFAKGKILAFLATHQDYKNEILKIYKKEFMQEVLEEVLIGYVFFLSQINPNFSNMDIFRSKHSLCYSPISIIDIL